MNYQTQQSMNPFVTLFSTTNQINNSIQFEKKETWQLLYVILWRQYKDIVILKLNWNEK